MNSSKQLLSFREIELSFDNQQIDVQLSGTLSLPQKKGKLPLVILFPSSGNVDRDSKFGSFKPFKIIAEYLARNGFAVFRFDKRGIGKSTGDFASATEEDHIQDGCALVSFLKNCKEIDSTCIGVVGHSEGGLISLGVASRSKDVSFVALLAGPVLPGREVSSLVFTLLVNEANTKKIDFEGDKRTFNRFFDLVSKDSLSITERKECIEIGRKMLPRITDKTKGVMGFSELTPDLFVDIFSIPWLHEFLSSKPETLLKHLSCPVLGIYGCKDVQVPIQNAKALNEILKESENTDYTVKEFVHANHLLQESVTGFPSEYLTNNQTIIPEILELLSTWILERNKLST